MKQLSGVHFSYGDGIAGRTYTIELPEGTKYNFGPNEGNDRHAKESAASFLNTLGFECSPKDITFKWDGTM